MLLLAVSAAGGIGGFAVLFLVARLGPRGTLAALGGAAIIAALLLPHSRTREAKSMSFAVNLVGVLCLVFGLVDLVRKPKKKRK